MLLDSLRQREATLSTEVTELQRSLNALQASGSNDQAAIENAQARLAALSILIGTVGATGPGVTVRIDDPGPGVAPQTMLDVLNELRAAGAEAIEISDAPPGGPSRGRHLDRRRPRRADRRRQNPDRRRIRFWPLAIRRRWPRR